MDGRSRAQPERTVAPNDASAARRDPADALAVPQPRALLARLQRPRAAARRGRAPAAARAGQVLRDLHDQPRRVLHGARRRPARPDRRRRGEPEPGRADPLGDDRADPRARARPGPAPDRLLRRRCCARRWPTHDIRVVAVERARRRAARRPRQALPEGDLPCADAAGGRPRAALPLHLEPVAEPRRARARPDQRSDGVRAREGADRDPAALRHAQAARARARAAGAARGRDRQPPRRPLPRHGDRRLRRLPRHPRRRPRGLRRRRRSAAGGRGRAAPPALRRGRARGGRRPLLTRGCARSSRRCSACRRRRSIPSTACSTWARCGRS